MKAGNHCIRAADGTCRIRATGYWKCTTEPPACAFKDADHAARVLEMCLRKLADASATSGSQ